MLYEATGKEAYIDEYKALIKEAYGDNVSVSESANDCKDIYMEAIEEWYAENGIEINDYERGRIDMFVEAKKDL